MRHRRTGRRLGRNSSHRKALFRNLASALLLTERDAEFDDNAPKVKGRIVTTLHKAKEVRPLVERCITIARRSLEHQQAAEEFAAPAERGSEAWKAWRKGPQWQKWTQAISPAIAARGAHSACSATNKPCRSSSTTSLPGSPIAPAVTRAS